MPAVLEGRPASSIFGEKYRVVPRVCVLVEHETSAKSGRKLRFGRRELGPIADKCNRRISETGDYATLVVGHTPDDPKASADMPPVIGFVGPFTTGTMPNGRAAVFADFHVRHDALPLLEKYPRRSPELWLADSYSEMFFDPTGLLGAEAPRLDMGMLLYRRDSAGVNRIVKYVRDFTDQTKGNTLNPIVQELMTALEATDWVQWVKQQMLAGAIGTGQPAAPLDAEEAEEGDQGESPLREKFQKARDLALRAAKRKAMHGQPVDYGEELAAARDRLGV